MVMEMKKKKIVILLVFLALASLLYSSTSGLNNYAEEKPPILESIKNL
jgi:hypothetical protein